MIYPSICLSSLRKTRENLSPFDLVYCYIDDCTEFANKKFIELYLVTARSKTLNVFVDSDTGVMGSNRTRDINVFPPFFCVCFVLCR
jgi:hypothetical protein